MAWPMPDHPLPSDLHNALAPANDNGDTKRESTDWPSTPITTYSHLFDFGGWRSDSYISACAPLLTPPPQHSTVTTVDTTITTPPRPCSQNSADSDPHPRHDSPASVRTVWPRFDYASAQSGRGVPATISEEQVSFANRAIAQSYESQQDLYLRPETYMKPLRQPRRPRFSSPSKSEKSHHRWRAVTKKLRTNRLPPSLPHVDANDDSLQRYKESLGLGGGQDLSDPNDPRVCIILSLSMETAGRDAVTVDLSAPGSQETLKDKPFQIKEGSKFGMVAKFKVQHEILSGLRYVQIIKRKSIKVGKVDEMIGSYAPNTDKTPVHSKKFPEYDAPSGMLARGHYSCSSCFVDDDKKEHLRFDWSFDIVKDL